MKVRIMLIALAACLVATETSNAQRGRGGFGGPGPGGFGGPGRGGFGGPGIGIGGPGIGIGIGGPGGWIGPGYGGYGGYYRPGYYYGSGYYNDYPYYNSGTYIAPATYAVNAPGGMQITEVTDDGAAKKAALRAGDIITSVGGSRTDSFEALQSALANAKGEVEVAFLNGANMKPEKTRLTPRNGKIGVAVVFAYVP